MENINSQSLIWTFRRFKTCFDSIQKSDSLLSQKMNFDPNLISFSMNLQINSKSTFSQLQTPLLQTQLSKQTKIWTSLNRSQMSSTKPLTCSQPTLRKHSTSKIKTCIRHWMISVCRLNKNLGKELVVALISLWKKEKSTS